MGYLNTCLRKQAGVREDAHAAGGEKLFNGGKTEATEAVTGIIEPAVKQNTSWWGGGGEEYARGLAADDAAKPLKTAVPDVSKFTPEQQTNVNRMGYDHLKSRLGRLIPNFPGRHKIVAGAERVLTPMVNATLEGEIPSELPFGPAIPNPFSSTGEKLQMKVPTASFLPAGVTPGMKVRQVLAGQIAPRVAQEYDKQFSAGMANLPGTVAGEISKRRWAAFDKYGPYAAGGLGILGLLAMMGGSGGKRRRKPKSSEWNLNKNWGQY